MQGLRSIRPEVSTDTSLLLLFPRFDFKDYSSCLGCVSMTRNFKLSRLQDSLEPNMRG
jgi:hypothetical protein